MTETANKDKKLKKEITDATFALLFGEKEAHVGSYGYFNGGGEIFDKLIRDCKDYLLFWREGDIFDSQAASIAESIQDAEQVVIPGPGSAFVDKEFKVLKRMPNLKKVVFIDIAPTFNKKSVDFLNSKLDELTSQGVEVTSITGRYQDITDKRLKTWSEQFNKTAVICSSAPIANIEENPTNNIYPVEEARKELKSLFRLAANDGYVLFGYDSNEKTSVLRKAYAPEHHAEFFLNALHYMFKATDGLRIEDHDGTELDKNDRETINRLFEFHISTGEFDLKLRNFPLMVKARESFKVYAPSEDEDEHERGADIEAGRVFTLMNSYKPATSTIRNIASNISEASKMFSVEQDIMRVKDNICIDSYIIKPKAQQPK